MASQQDPFSAEYRKGSEPTQADRGKLEQQELPSSTAAEPAAEPIVAKPVDMETKIYGTGKPHRVVIRGKISS